MTVQVTLLPSVASQGYTVAFEDFFAQDTFAEFQEELNEHIHEDFPGMRVGVADWDKLEHEWNKHVSKRGYCSDA